MRKTEEIKESVAKTTGVQVEPGGRNLVNTNIEYYYRSKEFPFVLEFDENLEAF